MFYDFELGLKMCSLNVVFQTIFFTALILIFYRAFPFLIFSKREVPVALKFVEKSLPPLIIAVLLVYCFKDLNFAERPFVAPNFIALIVVILLHIWKKNSMISILGGTILFMILSRVM